MIEHTFPDNTLDMENADNTQAMTARKHGKIDGFIMVIEELTPEEE